MPDLHNPLPKPEPVLRFPGSRRICGVRFGTLVKSANGKVAYTFSRIYNLPTQGQSTVITGDSTFKKLFSLVSSNDAPLPKTQYVQVDGPNAKDNLPKRQYKCPDTYTTSLKET
ncbi:hypothetical protein PGTUg99_010577 [Puccinia graminis f. sp. tritici]|uniref:Uncharacterized protein n=1 Tax=Puccinia graminis f. sp. tritici TaxID=56615 RepID=A0A5B0R7Q3_PUCGR|nr:hypothetical protein PGTUg99_010577 [Puccinia graminis f. sp. tritici]